MTVATRSPRETFKWTQTITIGAALLHCLVTPRQVPDTSIMWERILKFVGSVIESGAQSDDAVGRRKNMARVVCTKWSQPLCNPSLPLSSRVDSYKKSVLQWHMVERVLDPIETKRGLLLIVERFFTRWQGTSQGSRMTDNPVIDMLACRSLAWWRQEPSGTKPSWEVPIHNVSTRGDGELASSVLKARQGKAPQSVPAMLVGYSSRKTDGGNSVNRTFCYFLVDLPPWLITRTNFLPWLNDFVNACAREICPRSDKKKLTETFRSISFFLFCFFFQMCLVFRHCRQLVRRRRTWSLSSRCRRHRTNQVCQTSLCQWPHGHGRVWGGSASCDAGSQRGLCNSTGSGLELQSTFQLLYDLLGVQAGLPTWVNSCSGKAFAPLSCWSLVNHLCEHIFQKKTNLNLHVWKLETCFMSISFAHLITRHPHLFTLFEVSKAEKRTFNNLGSLIWRHLLNHVCESWHLCVECEDDGGCVQFSWRLGPRLPRGWHINRGPTMHNSSKRHAGCLFWSRSSAGSSQDVFRNVANLGPSMRFVNSVKIAKAGNWTVWK